MNCKNLLNFQLNTSTFSSLYALRDNRSLIKRLDLNLKLDVHSGCVNTICWSENDQSIILSGSDDQNLSISDAFTGLRKVLVHTGHKTNIFSAKFLPKSNDEIIVSSSSGGDIYVTDIKYPTILNNQNHYACHGDKSCYEVRTCFDPFIFTSCGQDGTVKWFDIRQSSKCDKQFCQEHTLLKISTGITTIAINPSIPYHLACGGLDGVLRLYDRRMLSVGSFDTDNQSLLSTTNLSAKGLFACFNPPNQHIDNRFSVLNPNQPNYKRITSVQYDNSGNQILASYQSDSIYLLDWRDLNEESKTESKVECNESTKNNEKCKSNEKLADLEPKNQSVQETTSSNSSERKFRIQSDWSDTGPNSMPFNEMEAVDPRAFLTRRLSEWFSNLTNNRSSSQQLPNSNRSSLNSVLRDEPIPSSQSQSTESNDSSPSQEPERRKSPKRPNSTPENNENNSENEQNSSEEENNESNNNSNEQNQNQTDSRRENFLSLTTSFIGSRLRTKQAIRLENNVIKSKPSPKVKMVFSGHRNVRTIIKECNFWGNEFVVSGSDCGHVFFWEKQTGKIVNIIEADKHVVNCVQENPVYPVLATSGIDYNVKIWQPTLCSPVNIDSKVEHITKRNKLMLEESKNTIFIPVQFMLPALRLFGANMGANSRSNTSTNSNNENNQNNNTSN